MITRNKTGIMLIPPPSDSINVAHLPLNSARARVRKQIQHTARLDPKLAGLKFIIIGFDGLAAHTAPMHPPSAAAGWRAMPDQSGTRFIIGVGQQSTLFQAPTAPCNWPTLKSQKPSARSSKHDEPRAVTRV